MKVNDDYQALIDQVRHVKADRALAEKLTACCDFTRLHLPDDEAELETFLQQASELPVAAVCVYPQYAVQAKAAIRGTPLRLACVANFPSGEQQLEQIFGEIQMALMAGADEIDLVFPYKSYLSGGQDQAINVVEQCVRVCEGATLKLILESGAFSHEKLVADVSQAAIASGVNFIKTSTGKISRGAGLDAAVVMLSQIHYAAKRGYDVGFKVSGGIRTRAQAASYYRLSQLILGEDWPTPEHFRIGCSKLLY